MKPLCSRRECQNVHWSTKMQNKFPVLKLPKIDLQQYLCENVAGYFKFKPKVVYLSETPRSMKGMSKKYLPVFWRSKNKAWVTKIIFKNWFRNCFCPEVKGYYEKNKWGSRAFLFDIAPDHPVLMEINASIPVNIVFYCTY